MTKALPKITVICPDCGSEFSTTASHIRRGRGKHCSKSCAIRRQKTAHGHSGKSWQSPTYNSWAGMRQRCTNPNHPKFPSYGGRGISVADEWISFEQFLRDMGERPHGMTLDRIDNDGPYAPENCRWATRKQQQNNQRRTVTVVFQGAEICLGELANRLGVKKDVLAYRVKAGWPEQNWGQRPWGGNRVS